MLPATAAPAGPVARPSASRLPPPNSASPDRMALRLPEPGKPRESMNCPVPSGPYPPNQPNSFCAPCAASAPPTPSRRASRPTSFQVSVMAPSFPVVEISTVPYAALGARLRSERCRDLGSALTLLAVSTERGGHRAHHLVQQPVAEHPGPGALAASTSK